MQMIW